MRKERNMPAEITEGEMPHWLLVKDKSGRIDQAATRKHIESLDDSHIDELRASKAYTDTSSIGHKYAVEAVTKAYSRGYTAKRKV